MSRTQVDASEMCSLFAAVLSCPSIRTGSAVATAVLVLDRNSTHVFAKDNAGADVKKGLHVQKHGRSCHIIFYKKLKNVSCEYDRVNG